MNSLKVLLVLFGLCLAPGTLSAKPVLWTLKNVVFSDGGTAQGSFVYDSDAKEFREVNIVTSGGNTDQGTTYKAANDRSGPLSALFEADRSADQTGHMNLTFNFLASLTDTGGTVNLLQGASAEITCANTACTAIANSLRSITGGTLDGVVKADDYCWEDCNTALGAVTSLAAAPNGGFWVQYDDSFNPRTLAINGAPQFDNVPSKGKIVAVPGHVGYWVISPAGHIYARGDAPQLCGGEVRNCSSFNSRRDAIQTAAATPDGQGLWAATYSGKVYTVGTAKPYGDKQGRRFPCSSIVATPTGKGYLLLFSDGNVYTFGDAKPHGDTKGKEPGGPARGLAASLDLNGNMTGYWMVAEDGGVFAFDAPFLGSTGGKSFQHVTDITALPNGQTYAWVDASGKVTVSRVQQTYNKVTFTSQFSNNALTAPSGTGSELFLSRPASISNQWFTVVPVSSDGQLLRFINQSSGLCVKAGAVSGGYSVIQDTCAAQPQPQEMFRLLPDGNGHVRLGSYQVSGQVIAEVPGSQLAFADPNLSYVAPRIVWVLTQIK